MVKHIVAWDYADGFTSEENEKHAREMKQELEALKDLIEGDCNHQASHQIFGKF